MLWRCHVGVHKRKDKTDSIGTHIFQIITYTREPTQTASSPRSSRWPDDHWCASSSDRIDTGPPAPPARRPPPAPFRPPARGFGMPRNLAPRSSTAAASAAARPCRPRARACARTTACSADLLAARVFQPRTLVWIRTAARARREDSPQESTGSQPTDAPLRSRNVSSAGLRNGRAARS